MDIYSREEFASCYSLRGYGNKKDALAWLGGREEAYEDDFEKCYHETQKPKSRRPRHGLASDGQNMDSASRMGNSRGPSFNSEIRREMKINDAFERNYFKKQQMTEEESK